MPPDPPLAAGVEGVSLDEGTDDVACVGGTVLWGVAAAVGGTPVACDVATLAGACEAGAVLPQPVTSKAATAAIDMGRDTLVLTPR